MSADTERGRYTSPAGSRTWERLAIFTGAGISMCSGFATGWDSPSITKLMEPDSPIPITASQASTLVVMYFVGMLGSLFSMFIIDRIGRKNTLLLSTVPQIVSWILIMIATNIWMLYTARILAGLFISLNVCSFPMYMGEITLPSTRGVAVALNVIMYNIGILTIFAVQPYLSISFSAGIFLAVAVGIASGFWFMPESPYHLAMKNRMEEAEETLVKLRGKIDVSDEIKDIVESVKSKRIQRPVDYKRLLLARGNRRAFAVVNLISLSQYLSGNFVIIAYCQLIFKSATDMISDHMAAIAIGTVQVISVAVTIEVIDRLGRKPLLLTTGIIAAAANFAVGVFFYAKEYLSLDAAAYWPVLFVAMMAIVFAVNCGSICLSKVLASEMFATEVKAFGNCFVIVIGCCIGIIMAKVYILVAVTWEYGHSPPFLTFCVATAICTAISYPLMPETKGKTFVQIQKELNG